MLFVIFVCVVWVVSHSQGGSGLCADTPTNCGDEDTSRSRDPCRRSQGSDTWPPSYLNAGDIQRSAAVLGCTRECSNPEHIQNIQTATLAKRPPVNPYPPVLPGNWTCNLSASHAKLTTAPVFCSVIYIIYISQNIWNHRYHSPFIAF